jgi:hypothetical protein
LKTLRTKVGSGCLLARRFRPPALQAFISPDVRSPGEGGWIIDSSINTQSTCILSPTSSTTNCSGPWGAAIPEELLTINSLVLRPSATDSYKFEGRNWAICQAANDLTSNQFSSCARTLPRTGATARRLLVIKAWSGRPYFSRRNVMNDELLTCDDAWFDIGGEG